MFFAVDDISKAGILIDWLVIYSRWHSNRLLFILSIFYLFGILEADILYCWHFGKFTFSLVDILSRWHFDTLAFYLQPLISKSNPLIPPWHTRANFFDLVIRCFSRQISDPLSSSSVCLSHLSDTEKMLNPPKCLFIGHMVEELYSTALKLPFFTLEDVFFTGFVAKETLKYNLHSNKKFRSKKLPYHHPCLHE